MSEKRAIGSCFGVDFYLDSWWKFRVESVEKVFETYKEMEGFLETFVARTKASKREKLSLPVVDGIGKERIITGVHAGHGKLILSPPSDKGARWLKLYPRAPWIAAAIAEKHGLERRSRQITRVLEEFQIEGYSGYDFNASQHAGEVDRIRNIFDALTQNAKNTDLGAEIEKLSPEKEIEF